MQARLPKAGARAAFTDAPRPAQRAHWPRKCEALLRSALAPQLPAQHPACAAGQSPRQMQPPAQTPRLQAGAGGRQGGWAAAGAGHGRRKPGTHRKLWCVVSHPPPHQSTEGETATHTITTGQRCWQLAKQEAGAKRNSTLGTVAAELPTSSVHIHPFFEPTFVKGGHSMPHASLPCPAPPRYALQQPPLPASAAFMRACKAPCFSMWWICTSNCKQ